MILEFTFGLLCMTQFLVSCFNGGIIATNPINRTVNNITFHEVLQNEIVQNDKGKEEGITNVKNGLPKYELKQPQTLVTLQPSEREIQISKDQRGRVEVTEKPSLHIIIHTPNISHFSPNITREQHVATLSPQNTVDQPKSNNPQSIPPRLTGSILHYRVNIIIIYRGKDLQLDFPNNWNSSFVNTFHVFISNMSFSRNIDMIKSKAGILNITASGLSDDHDYLAFLTGIYSRTDYVYVAIVSDLMSWMQILIDFQFYFINKVSDSKFMDHWIDSRSKQSYAVLLPFLTLRKVLMYTSLSFSSPSLFSILPGMISANRESSITQSSSISPSNEALQVYLNMKKCFRWSEMKLHSFAISLRLYRRNYLNKQLSRINNQTILPTIVLLFQNMHLVTFDIPNLQKQFPRLTIIHIWNMNWNSLFHFSYLVSSFLDTTFSFTYDDDQLLIDKTTHEQIINHLKKKDAIYSLRQWCWCKEYHSNKQYKPCEEHCKKEANLVANPFFIATIYTKYMWRYDIPTYYCCEEMSVQFAANIECEVEMKYLPIKFESYQKDNMDKGNDIYMKNLKQSGLIVFCEHRAMEYYLSQGFKPSFPYDPKFSQNVS